MLKASPTKGRDQLLPLGNETRIMRVDSLVKLPKAVTTVVTTTPTSMVTTQIHGDNPSRAIFLPIGVTWSESSYNSGISTMNTPSLNVKLYIVSGESGASERNSHVDNLAGIKVLQGWSILRWKPTTSHGISSSHHSWHVHWTQPGASSSSSDSGVKPSQSSSLQLCIYWHTLACQVFRCALQTGKTTYTSTRGMESDWIKLVHACMRLKQLCATRVRVVLSSYFAKRPNFAFVADLDAFELFMETPSRI